MRSKEEIEQLAKEIAELHRFPLVNNNEYEKIDVVVAFIKGYTQCQEDMAKQEEVDVICPKCKGVNEYSISDKGEYKCAFTDCQHKF
jgi:phage FluMu protein Com